MLQLLSAGPEATRVAAARVLGVALKFNADTAFHAILEQQILADGASGASGGSGGSGAANLSVEATHGRCLALGQVLRYNAERCRAEHARMIEQIRAWLRSDSLMVRKAAISDCKYVLSAYSLLDDADKVLLERGS